MPDPALAIVGPAVSRSQTEWLENGGRYAVTTKFEGLDVPRAFFVLIPGLALALAVFFRRRHFPEHLYVALHAQTAGFVAMTLATLVQYASAPTAIITATAIAAVAAAAYAIAALRRVYGGSWAATTARALGVALLYGVLYSSVTTAILLWATRR